MRNCGARLSPPASAWLNSFALVWPEMRRSGGTQGRTPYVRSKGSFVTVTSRTISMKPSTGIDSENLFVDTWGWLVLADVAHSDHSRVVGLRRQCTDRGGMLVTTDYVLDETITRLFMSRHFAAARTFCDAIFTAQREGLLTIEPITQDRFAAAYKLRLRYSDKPRISFTDLASFTVMRELGIRHVLTGDAHFSHVHLGFQVLP